MAGEDILAGLEGLEGLAGNINSYETLADTLGISLGLFTFLALIYFLWVIIWKGWALWKSANKKKIVWFISFLITNTVGLFPILYIFIFSKIKDIKSFRKIHDALLMALIVFIGLTIWNPLLFFLPAVLLVGLFSISLIQESVDRKELVWTILGVLLMPIVPIIYYFAKIRAGKGKVAAKPAKVKKKK